MSKTLAAGLQDHLDSRSTTMVYCWKVERSDGTVQGFTEHDGDLTFDSVTYLASSGFQASMIEQSLGLAVDNLNVESALSSDSINEDDLAKGYYDFAEVTIYWVNWQDVTERSIVDRGNLGEISRGETAFSAEFRSLADRLDQQTGRKYSRSCDAVLGDARCGVDLTSSSFKATGTVSSADGRQLVVTGTGTFGDGFFQGGVLTFTSGDNNGLSFEVKRHEGADVTLWEIPPDTVAVSDGYSMTAGCDRSSATCKAKFSNLANFRGFSHIPGEDWMTKYADIEEENMDGGSLFQ